MTLATDKQLGPHEILSPLGAGGMGVVYLGRDTWLDRDSADGQRLFVVKRAEPQTRTKLHVISNWFEELQRLVPTETSQ